MMHLLDEEPNFSDPEDFIDDVTDNELLDDVLRRKPKEIDGVDSVVVVDNVPIVENDRLEKLKNVLTKKFAKVGNIINQHYPMENGKTKGYIFIEYENKEQAMSAIMEYNTYRLDKQHVFLVNHLSDLDKYASVPDEWEPPEPQPFRDNGNLYDFLMDKDCIDQFSVIYEGGRQTAVYWNSHGKPKIIEERFNWTETEIRWSPNGTYLATFHPKGVALWGGSSFKQIQKFPHEGVQLIDFSPCERYLSTYCPMLENKSKDEPQDIIIWDILTGKRKRGFHCDNATVWPVFKWSHDGRYFARIKDDLLQVYETPSFGLVDKKSIRIKGIRDFNWSPTDNIISYWTPEEENTPARVVLMEIPSKQQICTKNLFTVADCKMYWQKSGDYLCVKVDRYKGRKMEGKEVKYSAIYHNLNVFRIREKQIPIDTVEVKENIKAFAWEPVGTKFAFIHGEQPRISVSFYNVKKAGSVELMKMFEKKTANLIFWSPQGQFVVLAGLKQMNGILEFIDTSDMTVMSQVEHFMATDVEWDPTGRYVTSSVSFWSHKVDNAFWIWNFQGKLLQKNPMDRFCQFFWRPRPRCLLSEKDLKEIKKNMKKYHSKFKAIDIKREEQVSTEQIEKRKKAMQEWMAYCEMAEKRLQSDYQKRKDLRKGFDTDERSDDIEFEEETVEFLVKVEEIVLEDDDE